MTNTQLALEIILPIYFIIAFGSSVFMMFRSIELAEQDGWSLSSPHAYLQALGTGLNCVGAGLFWPIYALVDLVRYIIAKAKK